jgi:hypothetical protein
VELCCVVFSCLVLSCVVFSCPCVDYRTKMKLTRNPKHGVLKKHKIFYFRIGSYCNVSVDMSGFPTGYLSCICDSRADEVLAQD